jgi:acyl-CoA reductase-like NAD-dependent aldehyde dehydrogenase
MAVAATGELRVVNPATLELVGTVTTTDPAAVQEIVSEAKLAHAKRYCQ